MTEKELTNWLNRKQDWILYKSIYFTQDRDLGKELRSQVLEKIWLYKDSYTRDSSDESIESWVFFIIKYAYFHMTLELSKLNLKKLDSYEYLHSKPSENTVLKTLQAETEINSITHKVTKNLSKLHSTVLVMSSDGYEQTEIADKLNLSKSYVNNLQTQNNAFMRGNKIKDRLSKRKEKVPIEGYRIDEEGNILEERTFTTPQDIVTKLNLKKSNVYRALEDEDWTAGGWHFKRKKL